MDDFFKTIITLDAGGDITAFLDFAQDGRHDPRALHCAIWNLLGQWRPRPAYILAMILTNRGVKDLVVSMALSVGGALYNNQDEKKRGLENLQAQLGVVSPEQHAFFYKQIVSPVIICLLNAAMSSPTPDDQVLRVLEILKVADPRCRAMFDWDAPVPELSLDLLRQRGRARARLVRYKLPPPGAVRQRRRVMVTGRETFLIRPGSRFMDMGLRNVAAMNAYGWDAKFHAMRAVCCIDECHAIVDACRQLHPDILFLDEGLLLESGPFSVDVSQFKQARIEMIAQLRQEHPSLKLVGFHHDAWSIDPATLLEAAASLDLLWEPASPSMPVWQDPSLSSKMLFLPSCMGSDLVLPNQPLLPQMLFAGNVNASNWHRLFWLCAARRLQLPIREQLSTHIDDGLPPLESHALYMRRLAEATCCVSQTMRSTDPERVCVVTARGFEVIYSGSLLVQEASPSMHYFFVAGEHYLEFATLAELSAIARFLVEKKEEAEEIRRCGSAFAHENYSDEKLIGYIDKALYFPNL